MIPLFNDLFVIAKLKGDVLTKYTAHLLHTLANWDVCSEFTQFSLLSCEARLLNKCKSCNLWDGEVKGNAGKTFWSHHCESEPQT